MTRTAAIATKMWISKACSRKLTTKGKFLILMRSNLSLRRSREKLGVKITLSEFPPCLKMTESIMIRLRTSKRIVFLQNSQDKGRKFTSKP